MHFHSIPIPAFCSNYNPYFNPRIEAGLNLLIPIPFGIDPKPDQDIGRRRIGGLYLVFRIVYHIYVQFTLIIYV